MFSPDKDGIKDVGIFNAENPMSINDYGLIVKHILSRIPFANSDDFRTF
ncbi:MAG: hypothetical protein P0116_06915 [Candidatus Nitrosocosmicus sp.]|nr:hypothetical protein [Candidatus Nitrosocosmicus sp.]